MKIYKFKDCVLNTAERSVLKDGKRLDLNQKTFDVLQLLVERAGEIVTKDELLGKVWNGNFVEEGNLPVQVGKLRRLLNETPSNRFIETVAGIGYRFVSSVDEPSNGTIVKPKDDNGNNFEAHRLYLKAKFLKKKGTKSALFQAIKYLQLSISKDPINAEAYAEIIHCYCLLYIFDYLSHEEAQTCIQTYLSVVADLGEASDVAQSILGVVSFDLKWDFPKAIHRFNRALELNESNLLAHRYLARLNIYSRRFSAGLDHIKQVSRLDPLSVSSSITLARLFYLMGLFDNAVNHLNEALELESGNYIALAILGAVYIELNDYDRALELLNQSNELHENSDTLSRIGAVHALTGNRHRAVEMIERIKGLDRSNSMNAIKTARVQTALGDLGTAIKHLEHAVQNREMEVLALNVEPSWRSLRTDPKFLSIINSLGIP